MNKPYPVEKYGPVDLKLGIKSSLPNVKATLALAVLLWESDRTNSTIVYSASNGNGLTIEPSAKTKLNAFVSPHLSTAGISLSDFENKVNDN